MRSWFVTAWVVVCVAAAVPAGAAPPSDSLWLGIWGGGELNWHASNFQQLPSVPNCCTVFRSGFGFGPSFGLVAEKSLGERVRLALHAGYFGLNGTLRATQHVMLPGNMNGPVDLTVEHTIEASVATLNAEPVLQWHDPRGGFVGFGVNAGIVANRAFHQFETIEQPAGATFDNGSRVQNDTSGTIVNASVFNAAIVAVAGWEFPLNASRSMLLAPSLTFSYALTPVVKGLSWHVNSLRAGVALLVAPREEPLAARGAPSSTPRPRPSREPIIAQITTESAPHIHVGATSVVETHSLLPYVFFDKDSSAIPRRYFRSSPAQTKIFREATLPNRTLEIYHHMLDILASRIRNASGAIVTLTGTVDNKGAEAGNLALAMARAQSVKNYWTTVWGIDSVRIRTVARTLPAKPTGSTEPEGDEENRRVEITSSSDELFQPVVHAAVDEYTVTPSQLVFDLAARPEGHITTWRLDTDPGDSLADGKGAPPAQFTWDLDSTAMPILRNFDSVACMLTVRDDQRRTATASVSVPFARTRDSAEIGRISLLMFDFDRTDITDANRRMLQRFAADDLHNASIVRITGTTDKLGEPSHNLELSKARADMVRTALLAFRPNAHIEECRGLGSSVMKFDNTLPEGRQYSRTVTIEVRTPRGSVR